MDSRILPFNEASLRLASQALEKGFLVGIPTETVYGLAANALDEKAVRSIFEVKGRPLIDPLIVHIASLKQAEPLAELSNLFNKLAQSFWPGPLTIVARKKEVVPYLVTAGQETVALRCPKHPVIQAVLHETGLALAAPSANPFGYISPSQAKHVSHIQDPRLRYILDGGLCLHGIESTIVDVSHADCVRILRLGPISKEDIETCLGKPIEVFKAKNPVKSTIEEYKNAEDPKLIFRIERNVIKEQFSSEDSFSVEPTAPLAPGMLTQHYSPHTPTYLLEHSREGNLVEEKALIHSIHSLIENLKTIYSKPCALVFFKKPNLALQSSINCGAEIFWLTESGNIQEAAQNLYTLLHALDKGTFGCIVIQQAPPEGIGEAINDRLQRAAAKTKI